MILLSRLCSVLRWMFKGSAVEEELDSELVLFIELSAADKMRTGMSQEEAHRLALLELGGIAQAKEGVRSGRHGAFVDEVRGDFRYAVRQLRRSPVFTLVAILILGIGIGATTAIFSEMNAVFLKTLPVDKPEQLRIVGWTTGVQNWVRPGNGSSKARSSEEAMTAVSYPVYTDMRDGVTTFSSLACWNRSLVTAGQWGLLEANLVSGNYFQTLGTRAILGRTIMPDDNRPFAARSAVVLSYRFWQRAFGGDPDVLGRTITINATSFAIVGVVSREFFGMNPANPPDLFLPMSARSIVMVQFRASGEAIPISDGLQDPSNFKTCLLVGRLLPGITTDQAQSELQMLLRRSVMAGLPDDGSMVLNLRLAEVRQTFQSLRMVTSRPLLLLLSAVAILLTITCVNLAGLLLARNADREKEIATRLALGATQGRVIRQLFSETLLLSLIGGAVGISVAYAIRSILSRLLSQFVPPPFFRVRPVAGVDVTPDWRVLLFCMTITVVISVAFGLGPALRASRIDLLSIIKGKRSITLSDRPSFFAGKVLVTIQVALSLLLLVGAGLFVRTILNLEEDPFGFDSKRLLTFSASPVASGYKDGRPMDFFEGAVKRLELVQEVTSVSVSSQPLIGALGSIGVCVPGHTAPMGDVRGNFIAPRLFETWKVPLLLGRDITWDDREDAPRVALINERFARTFYLGQDLLGQKLGVGSPCGDFAWTVVGVVGDARVQGRTDPPTVFLPFRQIPKAASPSGYGAPSMTIALRTRGDASHPIPEVRRIMTEFDPNVPVFDVMTRADIEVGLSRQYRALMVVSVVFAGIALLLCCLGIYGMLSYLVTSRISEIGVRIALGAQKKDVMRMVMRESLAPVAAGIALGLAAAFGLTRWIEIWLLGVSRNDPMTLAVAICLFLVVAAIAAFLPAARASWIDPLRTLRQQ